MVPIAIGRCDGSGRDCTLRARDLFDRHFRHIEAGRSKSILRSLRATFKYHQDVQKLLIVSKNLSDLQTFHVSLERSMNANPNFFHSRPKKNLYRRPSFIPSIRRVRDQDATLQSHPSSLHRQYLRPRGPPTRRIRNRMHPTQRPCSARRVFANRRRARSSRTRRICRQICR